MTTDERLTEAVRAIPIGAVIMRERAAAELDSDVADLQADASRFRSGTNPHHGRMAFAEAAKRQAGRIRALPIPTQAEVLAYARELPEVQSLAKRIRDADRYIDLGLYEMARNVTRNALAELAALEPKP